jgi:hypothetical protein
MPWNNERLLTDADGNFIPQVWDPSQNKFVPYEAKVQLSGNIASDSGLAANRPDAASVRAGFVYYSVDTDVIEYSDGAKWVVM